MRASLGLTAVVGLVLVATALGELVHPVEHYPEGLSREMWNMIRLLRSRVVPAQGVAKTEVDKVFGQPWQRRDGEQVYELLPHPGGSQKVNEVFKGLNLNVTYENDKVRTARIGPDSVSAAAKRHAGRHDDYTILSDLLHVHDKYCKRLKDAAWNREDPDRGN